MLTNTLELSAARMYAKEFGMSHAEWRMLAALSIHGATTVGDLGRRLRIDKGWISRAATTLLRKGWIKRLLVPQDGRKVLIDLTPTGRRRYLDVESKAIDRQELLLRDFSEAERKRIFDLLERFQRRADEMLGMAKDDGWP